MVVVALLKSVVYEVGRKELNVDALTLFLVFVVAVLVVSAMVIVRRDLA